MATENKAGDPQIPATAAADQPPAWFQAFAEKVEGRLGDFGRDVARLRKSLRSADTPQEPKEAPKDAPKDAPAPKASQEIDRTERMASIRYSDLRAQLPPKARKRLDERLEGGMSFATAIEQAEDLLEYAQETAPERKDDDKGDRANQSPKLPRGKAGTADSTATPSVNTRRELVALMKSDRAAYDRLMASPDFDPMTLRP